MYKNNSIKSTFEVVLTDNDEKELKITIYQPKARILKKLSKIKSNGDDFEILDAMTSLLAEALSNNKEKIEITSDFLEEVLDISDLTNLYSDYFSWALDIKKK